jgi:PIN domain nuclease of toxin-antitoxin system
MTSSNASKRPPSSRCERVARLPLHHRDPFDRLLVAQAQVEGATLVTVDKALAAYDVERLDASAAPR